MLLVAAALAGLTMFVAISTEHRLGPSAGGWITALPVGFTAALLVLFVGGDARSAGAVAHSAAAHVPAQVVFALAFAAGLRLRGLVTGVVSGALGYLVASCCLAMMADTVAIALSVVCLFGAPRLIATGERTTTSATRPATTALTCLAASAVVVLAVGADHLAGPVIGGAAGAFPTMSGTLVVAVALRSGPDAACGVLAGLVRSLPCYLVFCLTVALTASTAGVASLGIAGVVTAATAVVLLRGSATQPFGRVGLASTR